MSVDVRRRAVRRVESFRGQNVDLVLRVLMVWTIAIAEDRLVPERHAYRVRALHADPGKLVK